MASISLRFVVLLCACLSSVVFGQQETVSSIRLHWLGYLKGDFHKAKILAVKPTSTSLSDYGVLLDAKRFDPFEMYKYDSDSEQEKYSSSALLLIEGPSSHSDSLYTLELIIDKGIPVCTECDGGCAHLKKRRLSKITKQLKFSTQQPT